jgi:catechol 2,3-dioxygenase-like lactoylglutathione lyase family enzyme
MTKPIEMVNVRYMVADVDEAIAFYTKFFDFEVGPEMNQGMDRRKFIKGVGVAVLTVQFLPLIAHASGNSPSDGNEAADNLIIHSGPGFIPHAHDLLIPYAVLNAPPLQGVELETTKALFHRHNVVLTQEQLIIVNQGGTVTGKAGSHFFVIALAERHDHIQAG